jgi:large subunit ribosomal protein L31
MKSIHPKWYPKAKVSCACGNTFKVGATLPEIEVEVCSACHPFYTGQMKYVDTAGRVDAFQAKRAKAKKKVLKKSEKRALKKKRRIEKELKKPETLAEVRKQAKSKSKSKRKKKTQTKKSKSKNKQSLRPPGQKKTVKTKSKSKKRTTKKVKKPQAQRASGPVGKKS